MKGKIFPLNHGEKKSTTNRRLETHENRCVIRVPSTLSISEKGEKNASLSIKYLPIEYKGTTSLVTESTIILEQSKYFSYQ